MNSGPLYLSETTVRSLAISPAGLRRALANAYRLHAAGEPRAAPKLMLALAPGHFFQSMCAASAELGFAVHKWVGVSAGNAARGLPTVNSLVTLSRHATGEPVCLLDGNQLTVLRTAALSALAAEHLARPDACSIGFVGCGRQAHGHLHAFLDLLPGLSEAVCVSAGGASARVLAEAAHDRGIDARAASDPEAALACDVVVTSVQAAPGLQPFLDAARLRPGSFVSAVDLGASWRRDGLRALDIAATDDRDAAEAPATRARLAFPGAFDTDLAGLVSDPARGRSDARQRTMFMFPGSALADLAAAILVYETALRAGQGVRLPA